MKYFISLGSNVQPEKNIPAALLLLRKKFAVKKASSIYETDPVGPAGKRKFWNQAVQITAVMPADLVRKELRSIEDSLGRVRSAADKFASRTIDLDLLPQPGYQEQPFVMIPLAEIAPGEMDPVSGKTFGELAKGLEKEARSFRKFGPANPVLPFPL